jgi:prepilin-type N-terminal cleavage/methylation domain-containing protein
MHTDPSSPKPSARHGHHGFTLIELLVVIALVLTMAAITLAVVTKARAHADNVRAVLNMKEIGSALAAYMSEHDHLPTFQSMGVSAAISTADPYTQAYVLQPYLGINEPTGQVQYAKIFQPPGLKRDNMSGKKNWYEVTCYAMYSSDYFTPTKAYLPKGVVIGDDGLEIGPFGRLTGDGTVIDGWRPAQFDAALSKYSQDNGGRIATLSKVPAMLEINATYASSKGSWPWTVPKKPLRGDHVNVLYFDWRVESVTPQYFYKP